jgi:plastocyanin
MEPMKGENAMKHLCPGIAALSLSVAVMLAAGGAAQARDASDPVVVNLSLSKYASVQTIEAGSIVGVHPGLVRLHVGDRIVFVNDDSAHHTATSLLNAATFVDDPRWTDDALHQTGAIGQGFWSTGDLAPGQRSNPIVARKAGTYLFGCFFDYGAGMRGEIVVEP